MVATIKKITKQIVFFINFIFKGKNLVCLSNCREKYNLTREDIDYIANETLHKSHKKINLTLLIREIDLYLLDITINSWAPISKCVNFKNINGVNNNFLKKITCEYGKNYLGHCEESGCFVPLGVILLPKWYNHFNLNCHVLNGVDIDGRRWQLDLTSGALNLVDCYNDLDVHFIMMRVNCD